MRCTPERSLRKGIISERVPDKFPFRIDRGQLSRLTQSPPHRKYRRIVCSSQKVHRTRWRGQVRVNGHTTNKSGHRRMPYQRHDFGGGHGVQQQLGFNAGSGYDQRDVCVTVSSIHLLVGAEVNGIHRLIGVGARNVPGIKSLDRKKKSSKPLRC